MDMEKSLLRPIGQDILPLSASAGNVRPPRRPSSRRARLRVLVPLLLAVGCFLVLVYGFAFGQGISSNLAVHVYLLLVSRHQPGLAWPGTIPARAYLV